MQTEPLWSPSVARIASATVTAFIGRVERDWHVKIPDFPALCDWSVAEPEKFWRSLWDFCGVIAESRGDRVLVDSDDIVEARFFPDARLNFARNLLRRRGAEDAIVFWGEDQVRRRISFDALYRSAKGVAEALRGRGVVQGDRVAAMLPNMPEAIMGMLGAASIGPGEIIPGR